MPFCVCVYVHVRVFVWVRACMHECVCVCTFIRCNIPYVDIDLVQSATDDKDGPLCIGSSNSDSDFEQLQVIFQYKFCKY